MKSLVDVIVPTYNNPEYFDSMVRSMDRQGFFTKNNMRLIVVNNGKQPIKQQYASVKNMVVIDCKQNRGWEGGLVEGVKISDAPFVCFQNDDVFIPTSSTNFYTNLLIPMQDGNIGLVGPSTTVAAGVQSIYHPNTCTQHTFVNWLIFFCVMVRRSHLDAVGGIDETLPGGDDFDLSMRMTSSGYKLSVNPACFLIHHGFKTGERVKGSPQIDGGWNSVQFTDRVNQALIIKHGFKKFFNTRIHQVIDSSNKPPDQEGILISNLVNGSSKVLELGCGNRRTVQNSKTVDIRENVEADLLGDVTRPLELSKDHDVVIGLHILEHCVDTVETLGFWRNYLKENGRLFLAVPNHNIVDTIPLDPEHVHAFTPTSLQRLVEPCGFKLVKNHDPKNKCSFVGEYVKC